MSLEVNIIHIRAYLRAVRLFRRALLSLRLSLLEIVYSLHEIVRICLTTRLLYHTYLATPIYMQ